MPQVISIPPPIVLWTCGECGVKFVEISELVEHTKLCPERWILARASTLSQCSFALGVALSAIQRFAEVRRIDSPAEYTIYDCAFCSIAVRYDPPEAASLPELKHRLGCQAEKAFAEIQKAMEALSK